MQKHNDDDAARDSPALVAHAPRLSHAALLPHLDHACEGLHTRLPLGHQRHLPLHAHVGPGTKKKRKKKGHENKHGVNVLSEILIKEPTDRHKW